MRISKQSLVYVAVQLGCIAYLMLTGPWLVAWPWIWFEIAGVYLGAWTLWTFRLGNLRAAPEPSHNAKLVTRGPYRFIRHPMYAAVLLITLACVSNRLTPLRGVVWLILAADLIAKLRYEEGLLAKRFPEYAAYQRRTKRLVPFLF
jgi:protein-S-isoprenylcysteine O-methyltransferase Ste14